MFVNIFAYSEPYELDLLEIKLNLEDAGVDKWVIVENDHSLRGQFKGKHTLKESLNQERFFKFIHKIHVIETSYSIPMKEGVDNFEIIYYQRNLEKQWLLHNCSPDDWVIISDLDESVNFAERKDYILNCLVPGKAYRLIQNMYYLDFDNCAGTWEHSIVMQLKDMVGKYSGYNPQNYLAIPDAIPLPGAGYHYIFCMTPENILRKLQTYGHCRFNQTNIDSWCKFNHGMGNDPYATYKGLFHCEVIELNESNSPAFVRENLSRLRTNSVDINYLQNRELFQAGL